MNIVKINDLLGQVRVKLESLDPNVTEEGLQHMSSVDPKSIPTANSRVKDLIGKLTSGRSKANEVRATGSKKQK